MLSECILVLNDCEQIRLAAVILRCIVHISVRCGYRGKIRCIANNRNGCTRRVEYATVTITSLASFSCNSDLFAVAVDFRSLCRSFAFRSAV